MLCKPLQIVTSPDFGKYFKLDTDNFPGPYTPPRDTIRVTDAFILKYIGNKLPDVNIDNTVFLTDVDGGVYLRDKTSEYYRSVLYELKTKGYCLILLYPFELDFSGTSAVHSGEGQRLSSMEVNGELLVLMKISVSRELLIRIYGKLFNYLYTHANISNHFNLIHYSRATIDVYECKELDITNERILTPELTDKLVTLDKDDFLVLKIDNTSNTYYFISNFTVLYVASIKTYELLDEYDLRYKETYGLEGSISLMTIHNCTDNDVLKTGIKAAHYKLLFNAILADHPNLYVISNNISDPGFDNTYNFKHIKSSDIVSVFVKSDFIAKIGMKDVYPE